MGEMADFSFRDDADNAEGTEYLFPDKECGFCGAKGLQWVITEKGWRLSDKRGNTHTCKQYDAERGKT